MSSKGRAFWRAINALEARIERTSRAAPAPGFLENVYGGFDRADLTEALLAEYRAGGGVFPDVGYRHAGALLRARKLSEARMVYKSLNCIEAILMLAVVESCLGNAGEAEALIADYNNQCVNRGMGFMCTCLDKVAIRKGGDRLGSPGALEG